MSGKIGAIVQARVSSTRFPRKVLQALPFGSSATVLGQVVRRLKACRHLDQVIVATSDLPEDRVILEIAQAEGAASFAGSLDDVLRRYYEAACQSRLDVVVRVTSDCPCIDPAVVDRTVQRHLEAGAHYTSNRLKKTFMHGLDTEVIEFASLASACEMATEPFEREHVTPYFYLSHPQAFRIVNLEAQPEETRPDIRITLDTAEDYALLCAVYDFLHPRNPLFASGEILRLFDEKPWLKWINQAVGQKRICRSLAEEIEAGIEWCQQQDLSRLREHLISARTGLSQP